MASATESTPLTGGLYPFAAVDAAVMSTEISQNWGLILVTGVVNLIGGIFCLISPVTGTLAAFTLLCGSLIVVGCFNLFGAMCGYVESCYKSASGLVGVIEILIGVLMVTHAVESIKALTIMVAIMFFLDGIFRAVLAWKNRDMTGWQGTLISGICSIVFSILVISAFPASASYTLGILLGVNLFTYGLARITLGMMGRNIANNQIEGGTSSYVAGP